MYDATKDADERRYATSMARMCSERGHLNLAQAYALAAQDCPQDCPCTSCSDIREEREAERRRKAKRKAA